MSSIIFDGNTYTFGATVSANPGTGTTSYVFGGLSSGATFGFILRAFNGFGFSDFVGPVIQKLSETIEETRDLIASMAWTWPYYGQYSGEYVYQNGDPNSINLLPETNDLRTGTVENRRYYAVNGGNAAVSVETGFTAPDGTTTAWEMVAQPSVSYMINLTVGLEPGYTYYVSYYHDLGRGPGTTGMFAPQIFYPNPTRTVQCRQILPVVGSFGSGQKALYPTGTGFTSWTRFAYEFYRNPSVTGNNYMSLTILGPDAGKTGYFWGPQLEKAL
jgi:hypothetical protein